MKSVSLGPDLSRCQTLVNGVQDVKDVIGRGTLEETEVCLSLMQEQHQLLVAAPAGGAI